MTAEPLGLRDEGRLRVLQALHDNGSCRRGELMQITGLSRSTVSSLVAELVARGIVTEQRDNGTGAIGRPAGAVSLTPTAGYAVGVDVGHQHVRVAVCDLRGAAVADVSARREVDLAPKETLDLAARLVRQALRGRRIPLRSVIGLGLGIAAPVHTDSGLIEATGIMPGWVGVRPVDELRRRTKLDVHVNNDADAGALGERMYGVARGVHDLIYVRLSAGIGAGIISGGRPLHGANGLAGELGHVPAVPDGPICRCGNRGCLETVASPVAVAHLLAASWRREITWAEVLRLVATGDPGACRAVSDAGEHVGRAVAAAVNLLNPTHVVIGGDLADTGEVLLDPIRAAIRRYALPAASAVTVVAGALGERAEVLGAATIALAEFPRRLAQPPHDRAS